MTKQITNFNFKKQLMSGQDAHVSFVKEGANNLEVVLMKAKKQVTVSTDMVTFLRKFYDMWYDDAEELATVLGFDVDTYSDEHDAYLEDKAKDIVFMKGKEIPNKLPESLVGKIKDLQKTFEDFNKNDSSESLINEKGDTMPKATINADELDLQKSLDAKAKENADLLQELADFKKSQEDLVKSNAKLVADMDARKEADLKKAKDEMSDLVKCFNFVKEESREALTDVLMSNDVSAQNLILEAFTAATDLVKSSVESEVGEDFEEAEEADLAKGNSHKSRISELLKSMKK